MREVTAELAAAIESPEHTVRARLSVDWGADGHGPAGSVDDLSNQAASVEVKSVLQGTLPDQVAVVEGTATATFTADLVAGDRDDEQLQAVRYFSPFNTDSPLHGLNRLNRDVQVDAEFYTSAGWQGVPLLRGVSRALPVRVADRSAGLTGLDYRSRFRTPVSLPAMAADAPHVGFLAPNKPGLEGTWIVSYVMWQCGFPLSPPPPAGCVIWVPMHGSAMPFIGAPFRGSPVAYNEWLNAAGQPTFPLEFGPGPYVLATRDIKLNPAGPGTQELFNIHVNPASGAAMFDSNGRSKGRMTGWFKAGSQPQFNILNERADGPSWGPLFFATFSLTNNGTTRNIAGPIPPFDDQWHFCGVQWDDAAGRAEFNVDGGVTAVTFTPTPAAPGADNNWQLITTSAGPTAEWQVSTGLAFTDPWPPMQYTAPADVDRSALRLDGIAGDAPTEGWEILQELAAAEQGAMYLTPERPVYATRGRLISDAAQTVQREVTADAHLFDLAYDYSLDKVANVVTGAYQPVEVTSQIAVWSTQQLYNIPPGATLTFLATYSGIATSQRFVTGFANTAQDGSGASYGIGSTTIPSTLTALSETASRITVTNLLGVTVWLVDTGGRAALALVGDQVAQGDGGDPAVVVDEASRAAYGDQPLELQANRWVQRREFGFGMAVCVLGDLAQPRPVFAEVPVPLDPRLEYFDRLRLVDADNTGVEVDVWTVGLTHQVAAGDSGSVLAARPSRDRYLAGVGQAGIDLVG